MSQLPQGWCESPLSEVAKLHRGVSYKKNESSDLKQANYFPVLRANNIQNGKLILDELVYVPEEKIKDNQFILAGDIVVAMSSGSKRLVGKSGIAKQDHKASFGAFCGLLRPIVNVDARYIGYFTRSKYYQDTISELSKGVNINNLKPKHFDEIVVPLAPKDEQKRIADKLDSVLAKVEAVQARLDKIPTILKRFRQSVLAAATSGELTKDWREENLVDNWESRKLIELIEEKPRNGRSPKGVDYKTRYRNLTLSATTQGKFVEGCFKYVELDINDNSHLWVKNGDILIQRANSLDYVGVSALYEGEDNQYVYPDLIMKCRANEQIKPKYLHYCLLSEDVRKYFRDNATGTAGNMPKINQTTVSAAPINLPSLDEQSQIIVKVECLFEHANTVEKQYKAAKARIDKLAQSILAKAFRGELV